MEVVNTIYIKEGNKKKVAAVTLGCKVNTYDTQAMLELLENAGYQIVDFSEKADIYIINTCTVTNAGDKKSRQLIRRAKRQNSLSIVVVTGCYAQVSPEEVALIEGVNIVIGTKDRNQLVNIIEKYHNDSTVSNNVSNIAKKHKFERLNIEGLRNHTRAYLKIQEGCDNFCSYCIIPYARGSVRSREEEDVLNEVNILAKNGFKEIVLVGIHIASYGKDLNDTNLLKILNKVSEVDGIERIRFSSIEPNIITENFVSEISKIPKICDHFHLSLQSGCNNTLARMNRRYNTDQYAKSLEIIRSAYPDSAITTDIIVGFPGETDNDFEESYNFINSMKLAKIHVFPFSPRKGTKAATFTEQIDKKIKEQRAEKMNILDRQLNNNFIEKFNNRKMDVLFETEIENSSGSGKLYKGHTTNYIEVSVCTDKLNLENKIMPLELIYNKHEAITYGKLLE